MSLWRLEWTRLTRTKRWVALVGVFVFFGLVGPLGARYLDQIVSLAGGELEGATVEFPEPVPADGMAQFVSNAMQVGTLVAVVVAAGALAFDAVPEMGIFLRTRARNVAHILTPRVVVTAAAVVVSFVLGAGTAWYETWVLIGPPDPVGTLAGIGYGALFLVFVVALVAAVAGRARSVLATVMGSILVLLVMPVVGVVEAIGRWLPTHLGGSLGALTAGVAGPGDYVGAAVVTVLATAVLLWAAVALAERREL